MKKNNLKVFGIVGAASIITFAITPLIVSCSKEEEDLSNVKMYDKNYRMLFNGAGKILDYDGNATELEIPEYLENNSVTSSPYYGKRIKVNKIGYKAFQWDEKEDSGRPKLQKIKLSSSITYIESYAFSNNELTQVTIPDSVEKLEANAFYNNTQLTQVTIPDSVTYIGDWAFNNTQLTQVTIPDSVTYIGNFAFANTQLTQVTIPNSIIRIRYKSFANTQLTQVTIPDSVTYIDDFAFASTQLTQVELPPNCKYKSNAFPANCNVIGGIKID